MFPSNAAGEISRAFSIITAMCVVLLVIVTTAMLVFVFEYNKKKKHLASETRDNILLEITWTIVPTVLVLIMFYFGWMNFDPLRGASENAVSINVIGRQLSFKYQNRKGSDVLRVPVGKPVRLDMTSLDVIHSFFGSKVTVMTDGRKRTIRADDEYNERSIRHPQADIVKGYPPVMPTIPVTEEQMEDIIAYMRTLK